MLRRLADILEPIVTEILRRRAVPVGGISLVAGDAVTLPKGFSFVAVPNESDPAHEKHTRDGVSPHYGAVTGGAEDGLGDHLVRSILERTPEIVEELRPKVVGMAERYRAVGIEPERQHFSEIQWHVYQSLSPLEGGPNPTCCGGLP